MLSEEIKLRNSRMNTVSGIRTRESQESWKKAKFRKSYEWKHFCETLIIARGGKCERCHSSDRLVVHHKDPLHYSDLRAEKFSVLCNSCHLIIESQCKSEEMMKAHPENRKWHTFYPYNHDPVKWQSGTGTLNKWVREASADINRPEQTYKREQIKEAYSFMREHPELFS